MVKLQNQSTMDTFIHKFLKKEDTLNKAVYPSSTKGKVQKNKHMF